LGALLARHFSRDFPIHAYDPKPGRKRAGREISATFASACAQSVVVICVPIAEFERVVRRAAPLLRPGTLIVDTCSVKEHPVRVMKRYLPRSVDILATHPNFGPDSAAESLEGRQLAVCKVRISSLRWKQVRAVLRRHKLVVLEMSAAEHDRRSAQSLVLTHFIGRTLIANGSRSTGLDTEGYKRLLRILQTVQNDSWRLFEDMNRFNRFAGPMRKRFLAKMRVIDRRVAK
jgi:prephenate dehydrogenase